MSSAGINGYNAKYINPMGVYGYGFDWVDMSVVVSSGTDMDMGFSLLRCQP